MRRWLDRALVAGALLVIGAAVIDTFVGKHRHRRPPAAAVFLPAAPTPARVALHSSPDVAFLRDCPPAALRLEITPRELVLRYSGPPCHLRGLRATANVVDVNGAFVLGGQVAVFGGNLAGVSELHAPLFPRLARCVAGAPLDVVVRAASLSAHAHIPCPLRVAGA